MPERIQLSRAAGWRMPPNTVKVDQTTKWGNPWVVGSIGIPDAAEAVRRFRASVIGFESNGCWCPPNASPDSYIGRIIARAPIDLRGKNLACWCEIISHGAYVTCHADVLLSLANDISLKEVIRENTLRAEGKTL
jgi:hypothetical protein